MKYHNSSDGPRVCRATMGRCPYGLAGEPHFDNFEKAQVSYEKSMVATFGTTANVRKAGMVRSKYYRDLETLSKKFKIEKAGPETVLMVTALDIIRRGSSKVVRSASRGILKTGRFALRKPDRNKRKLFLTKYWMPDIHSNRWK